VIPIPGGQARLAKLICSFAPQSGGTYYEPFAGRGNVFWTAAGNLKYRRWWLNDTRRPVLRGYSATLRTGSRSLKSLVSGQTKHKLGVQ
jgi:site-specific DNA-adenine methylase